MITIIHYSYSKKSCNSDKGKYHNVTTYDGEDLIYNKEFKTSTEAKKQVKELMKSYKDGDLK